MVDVRFRVSEASRLVDDGLDASVAERPLDVLVLLGSDVSDVIVF